MFVTTSYKMKQFRYFLLSYWMLSVAILSAQLNPDHFENMKIRNIGPAGMSGRITAIDVDLSNPTKIFVGAASGGVWLSENGGISWKPVFDKEKTLAIGSIKINQHNPAEIWVGTGEGNPRNSMNTGRGIYKSIDGGKTWKNMGLEQTKTIHRIVIHKDDPNTVFVASLGSPWGPNKERGVFKTTDGGKTWKNILFVNDLTGAADMVVDPSNPNKMLVAMWEHKREPWYFHSGGKGSGLYITYDAGENWTKMTKEEGFPDGELGRIGLAFAPSKPSIIYALVESKENGLYKSTDGGKKWQLVSSKNIGDRPFYYSELYVDPSNENRIFNVYTYLSVSEDGGKSFREIANYGNAVHPDHHAFWIHPKDPDFIIDGNDGGLNISRDRGETWQFAGNIPVGQFYHINVDDDFPYNVYGGMQDNGSWVGPAFVLRPGGIRNFDYQELYFGDGFDVMPYPEDSRYGYAMSQGGNVAFYDRLTGQNSFIKPVHPDAEVKLRYNWNAPLAQDPFQSCGIYFGSQFLHYSPDCGANWEILSPDLTTNNPEKQKADISGGLTPDATNAENHTTLIAIAPSPLDKNVIWTGSDDGQLHVTKDKGKTWTNVSKNLKDVPEFSWIAQIEASSYHPGEAFVVINNYRRNDYAPYAYFTKDYGKTWERIADSGKIGSFVLSLVQDPENPNLLFLGADDGLYISLDKGKSWTHWNKNIPSVQVNDMKIQKRFGDLAIGTFGRAFWIMDDIRPLRALANKGVGLLDSTFVTFETPDVWLVSNTSYQGIRFSAQGEFTGDNKSESQSKTYVWIKPEKKTEDKNSVKAEKEKDPKEKDPKEKDSKAKNENTKDIKVEKSTNDPVKKDENKIYVDVYDETGTKIRSFSQKTDDKEGITTVIWNLRKDGIMGLKKEKAKEEKEDLPAGRRVLPGSYKLVFQYKGKKDSTMVRVNDEPRKGKFWTDFEDETSSNEIDSLVTKARKAYDKVLDARQTIELVDKLSVNQPDSVKKEIKRLHKDLNTALDSIQHLFFNKDNQKGIQRDPDIILSKIFQVNPYISGKLLPKGNNGEYSLKHAQAATEAGLNAIRLFFEKDWPAYKKYIDPLDWNLFKE